MRSLEKDPSRRPASAAALVEALASLQPWAADDPSSAERKQRRRLQLVALVGFFAIVAAVGGWGIYAALAAARRPSGRGQPARQEKSP